MKRQAQSSTASVIGSRGARAAGVAIALALVLLLAQGCASQATFNSPDSAVDSLIAIMRAHDKNGAKDLLGPDSDEVIFSGDAVEDKQVVDSFLKAYDEKHQLVADGEGTMTLVAGNSDWPMPIPIVREGKKWRFDTKAGEVEMLNRRIGQNELSAVQTCLAILDAQREYVSLDLNAGGPREYAARFMSEPGKKNGLFWPTAENEPPSPLGPLVAAAAWEGYTRVELPGDISQPFHGYRFRILTCQGPCAPGGAIDYKVNDRLIGGFALVAWPAEYGISGIMTFIMNHDGIVYQRDLGEGTAEAAATMSAYDPDPDCEKVEPDK